MDEQKAVEILNARPGEEGSLLPSIYDWDTGTYYAPQFPSGSDWAKQIEALHAQGLTGKGVSAAVIDTGVVSTHPWIARRLKWMDDFRGVAPKDAEDRNGHGTAVALLLLATSPDVDLYSLKIMDAEGYGTEEVMIRALEWVADNKIRNVNASAGMYRNQWQITPCQGDCPICQAAERAAAAGCIISAAAGNEPGETACPGTLGVKKGLINVIEAWDYERASREDYSGYGTVAGPIFGKYERFPVS